MFGQPQGGFGGFGANTGGGLFGATVFKFKHMLKPAACDKHSLFLQSANKGANTGGGMFGQNSGGAGGGLFGQNTGGGLFGAPQNTGGGLFGGAAQGASPFGQNTGGGLFGQQPSSGGGLFGGNAGGGFGFGQSQGGGLFGQQSSGGGLFGQPSSGGGLFGGGGGGAFGQSSGGGLFGQPQTGGMFGQSSGGGLFGQNTGGGLFGQPAGGGGLFGAAGGGFGGAVSGTTNKMQEIIDQETKLKYGHIGAMDCYKNKSFEEPCPQSHLVTRMCCRVCCLSYERLRMEDYQANRLQAGQGRSVHITFDQLCGWQLLFPTGSPSMLTVSLSLWLSASGFRRSPSWWPWWWGCEPFRCNFCWRPLRTEHWR